MSRAAPSFLLALALAPLPIAGCDSKSDDELRAMIGDVTQAQIDALQTKIGALETSNGELKTAQEGLVGRIDALESELSKLTPLVTELDTQLRDNVKRIDDLEAKALPTAPTVKPGRPDPAEVYRVEIGDAPTKGPDDALVTIVIFSDFQCPYCKRVTATLKTLEADYGKDLRLVFKHNPLGFHPNAMPAAKASMSAHEQGKFWEMHDKLFENNTDLTDKNFVKWAKELKLDVKQFERDLSKSSIATTIADDQAQAGTLGANGTPAFFVNGRFLSGAQPVESFKTLIDDEMTKAKALVAGGTARDRVYAETIAKGKSTP